MINLWTAAASLFESLSLCSLHQMKNPKDKIGLDWIGLVGMLYFVLTKS